MYANYSGEPGSIASARDLARDFLARLERRDGAPVPERVAHTLPLVVSELVTNAGRHAPGPCLLDLRDLGHAIEITVWDTSCVLPHAFRTDPHRIGGHGMEIVARLCSDVRVERAAGGKRVRTLLDLA
ncbi:ATP-binding protein [Wenjunlia tyrosinilytica]|nr:ATP-binding protein [Wenjunlia tyrosinilytica]